MTTELCLLWLFWNEKLLPIVTLYRIISGAPNAKEGPTSTNQWPTVRNTCFHLKLWKMRLHHKTFQVMFYKQQRSFWYHFTFSNFKIFWEGTQSAQFWAKFRTKLPIFSKIFLILSQFWLKFGQILKNRPIHIPDFAFYKGSFIYQEADSATHVSSTSP